MWWISAVLVDCKKAEISNQIWCACICCSGFAKCHCAVLSWSCRFPLQWYVVCNLFPLCKSSFLRICWNFLPSPLLLGVFISGWIWSFVELSFLPFVSPSFSSFCNCNCSLSLVCAWYQHNVRGLCDLNCLLCAIALVYLLGASDASKLFFFFLLPCKIVTCFLISFPKFY